MFASRFTEALAGRSFGWLSEKTGFSSSTLHDYAKGRIPAGDRVFILADAFDVLPRWLVTGQGPQKLTEASESDAALVQMPFFDLFAFTPEERPEPVEHVPIPRDWLTRAGRGGADLWLAEMPTDLPNVAREGDTVILRDPDVPLADGRVYVLLLDGRPIVRRVALRPEGLTLKGGPETDPIVLSPDQLERLVPIGRIMAAINLTPV